MATTTARNQQDVNNMSARDRLWDSLNYSYGKKREESDKSFAKAYSQAVNQGIRTGMQRSSYGAQTLANINKQQIDAQNDIYDSLIADYENRVYQLERDELEDAWKQKQFDENQRQYNENLAFQKSQADRSQANWEKEFAETLAQNQWNREYAQDEFKYKYGLAGAGSGGSSGGGGGGYSGGYSTPGTTDTSGYDDNATKALAQAIGYNQTAKNISTAATNVKNTVTSAANTLFKAVNGNSSKNNNSGGFLNINNNKLNKKSTTK